MIYIKVLLLIVLALYGCAPTQVATTPTVNPPTEQKKEFQQKEIVVEEGTIRLQLYKGALDRLKSGDYEEARKEFKNFLINYPKDELADNAQYWIGECLYARKDFEGAILEFDEVIKKYPSGDKVPAALLKQGLSFLRLGDKLDAKTLLSRVIKDFPHTEEANIAKKNLEQIETPYYVFSMVKPKESRNLTFEDSLIRLEFSISNIRIEFVLHNKRDSVAIKIDWNQVSYVDVRGVSHRVIHSGIKYIEKDALQSPTIVPPTAKIEDIIVPSDYIYYDSDKYSGGWQEPSLFPEGPDANLYKGLLFSIFMPLEINRVVQNYLFTFKIDIRESEK